MHARCWTFKEPCWLHSGRHPAVKAYLLASGLCPVFRLQYFDTLKDIGLSGKSNTGAQKSCNSSGLQRETGRGPGYAVEQLQGPNPLSPAADGRSPGNASQCPAAHRFPCRPSAARSVHDSQPRHAGRRKQPDPHRIHAGANCLAWLVGSRSLQLCCWSSTWVAHCCYGDMWWMHLLHVPCSCSQLVNLLPSLCAGHGGRSRGQRHPHHCRRPQHHASLSA